MLAGWLFKKLVGAFQDWVESKEGQEYMHEVLDAEIDRQLARLRGSAGGMLQGPKDGGQDSLIGMFIQALLPNLMGKAINSSVGNVLPEKNPFGT